MAHADKMQGCIYQYIDEKGKRQKLQYVYAELNDVVNNNLKSLRDCKDGGGAIGREVGVLGSVITGVITGTIQIDHGRGEQRAVLVHRAREDDGLKWWSKIGSYEGKDQHEIIANTLVPLI
jgi:hypothetical protein